MASPSEYFLEPIRHSAEFMLYDARQCGNPSPFLVAAPGTEPPSSQSLRRVWSTDTRSAPNLSLRG
jgi:hypothetical protein